MHKFLCCLLSGLLAVAAVCLCICVEAACAGAFGISSYSVYDTYLHQADEVKALVEIGRAHV